MIVVLLSFWISHFLHDNVTPPQVTLQGAYQGKNLYVQNPFTSNLREFCATEVLVNEVKVLTDIKSSAFEIDLSSLEMNESVNVVITHKEDCKPKILNPQVIRLSNSFQFSTISIQNDVISWVTKGEKIGDKLVLEQFLYNNWLPVREFSAKGSSTLNNYTTDQHHTSGLNKYRVKYIEKGGNTIYSNVVEHSSNLPEVTFYPKRVSNKIYLSRNTEYEIIDGYGNVISKGSGKEIPCESLHEGVYYLNVDNKTEKFLKK